MFQEGTLRVVRVQLENGERLVGVRYPHTLLHLVEKAIDEQRMLELAQRQQRQLTLQLMQQLVSKMIKKIKMLKLRP